jgi:hypothetical protein
MDDAENSRHLGLRLHHNEINAMQYFILHRNINAPNRLSALQWTIWNPIPDRSANGTELA